MQQPSSQTNSKTSKFTEPSTPWTFKPQKSWTLVGPKDSGAPDLLWAVHLTEVGYHSYDLIFVLTDGSRKWATFSAGSEAYAFTRAVDAVERALPAIHAGQPWDLEELRAIPGLRAALDARPAQREDAPAST